jgi:hypothetical protein
MVLVEDFWESSPGMRSGHFTVDFSEVIIPDARLSIIRIALAQNM